MQPNPAGRVRTGACLKFFNQRLSNRLMSDSKRTPLMFLVTQSKSSDDISKVSQQIKGSGCKTIGIGITENFVYVCRFFLGSFKSFKVLGAMQFKLRFTNLHLTS